MNRYEIQSHCSRMLVKPYSICEQIRLSIVMKLYFYLTGSLALTSTAHMYTLHLLDCKLRPQGLRSETAEFKRRYFLVEYVISFS
jgi:hypothetical protein